jgi:hypothetical protein
VCGSRHGLAPLHSRARAFWTSLCVDNQTSSARWVDLGARAWETPRVCRRALRMPARRRRTRTPMPVGGRVRLVREEGRDVSSQYGREGGGAPNAHADACRGRATHSPTHAPHAPRVVWDGQQEAGGQGAGLRRPASECSRRTTETFLTRASEGGCAKPERGSTREAPSPARRTEPDAAAQKLPDKAAGVPISPVRHPRSVIKGRNGPSWQASTADVATGKTRGMTLGGRAASLIASC